MDPLILYIEAFWVSTHTFIPLLLVSDTESSDSLFFSVLCEKALQWLGDSDLLSLQKKYMMTFVLIKVPNKSFLKMWKHFFSYKNKHTNTIERGLTHYPMQQFPSASRFDFCFEIIQDDDRRSILDECPDCPLVP